MFALIACANRSNVDDAFECKHRRMIIYCISVKLESFMGNTNYAFSSVVVKANIFYLKWSPNY